LPVIETRSKRGDRRIRAELSPVYVRHWVKSALKTAGVPKRSRSAMMGHEGKMSDMDEYYDNLPSEELLLEQEQFLPSGLLATHEIDPNAPKLVVEGLPEGAVRLLQEYWTGKIPSTMEFASQIEAARLRSPMRDVTP